MLLRDILQIKGNRTGGAQIHSVPPDTILQDALRLMTQHDVGSLVVLQGDQLHGLMTLREVLVALSARGAVALGQPVGEIMNDNLIVGSPDDSIDCVRRVMTENHISHLPVIGDEHLLGVISLQDVAKAAYSECSFENRLLKRYINDWPEPETEN
ncbi:MAG: hypothetical protein AzoDbin1_03644 [Azoarcus sp.]|nr:hypothetical protein [Azoarcus sp.]